MENVLKHSGNTHSHNVKKLDHAALDKFGVPGGQKQATNIFGMVHRTEMSFARFCFSAKVHCYTTCRIEGSFERCSSHFEWLKPHLEIRKV